MGARGGGGVAARDQKKREKTSVSPQEARYFFNPSKCEFYNNIVSRETKKRKYNATAFLSLSACDVISIYLAKQMHETNPPLVLYLSTCDIIPIDLARQTHETLPPLVLNLST